MVIFMISVILTKILLQSEQRSTNPISSLIIKILGLVYNCFMFSYLNTTSRSNLFLKIIIIF